MVAFDFDAARRERDAKADPPTITVGGQVYTLPASMPAAVSLDLMAHDEGDILDISEVVRLLKRVYPPDDVDRWLDDSWTYVDLYELMATTLAMVRGIDPSKAFAPPDDDAEDGGSGEAPAPDNGRGSPSKAGGPSKPTSKPTTGSTSRTRTRSRS